MEHITDADAIIMYAGSGGCRPVVLGQRVGAGKDGRKKGSAALPAEGAGPPARLSLLAQVADRRISLRSGEITEVLVNPQPLPPEEVVW